MLDLLLGPGLRRDGVLKEGQLLPILWVFFIAGHDTTAISLTWLMHFLAHYPEVRKGPPRWTYPGGTPKFAFKLRAGSVPRACRATLGLRPKWAQTPTLHYFGCLGFVISQYEFPSRSQGNSGPVGPGAPAPGE